VKGKRENCSDALYQGPTLVGPSTENIWALAPGLSLQDAPWQGLKPNSLSIPLRPD
jgi:hypothetical protein